MNNSALFDTAKQYLFTPFNLDFQHLEEVFAEMKTHAVDYADLYFEYLQHESWSLEESQVKVGSFNIDQGVGVRAVSGEKTAFAYSDEINLTRLKEMARTTRAIAEAGQEKTIDYTKQNIIIPTQQLYDPCNPLHSLSADEKVKLLESIDHYIRQREPRIKQVMASLSGTYTVVLIARHDGLITADIRPLVRLDIVVLLEENGRIEQGHSGGGGRRDYSIYDTATWMRFADQAIHQASVNLNARTAPAGLMPVVLGAGWPGILLHEAIGHGLEGDFNRRGSSAFSGRIGERVAAKGITIVDNGTLPHARGSLNIDDEGTPTQCTTLIEDGILKGYLQDTLNARLMQTTPTGNGRRNSYAHIPIPRMTNTYMLNGEHSPEEIINSVKNGLYAVNFGGGQVDITNGKFVFSAVEAYLIENGKITDPVKGVTLIGNGPDILTKVSLIGNDMRLDDGVGTCGKEGQSVPVGVGQPTLLVDEITVGGTES